MSLKPEPVLPLSRARVFFDATLGPLRLKHPEGLAIAADGAVWCGGDGGEIYRIEPDGSAFAQVASTGGFTLGLAFDGDGLLYACDLGHAAVFRLDPATGALARFAEGPRIPNMVAWDPRRDVLYVSDSHHPEEPGGGVWRVDRATGRAEWWLRHPFRFANGIALYPDGSALAVVESFGQRLWRVPILADGAAGAPEVVAEGLERVPDGVAFGPDGAMYVSCYEPSRLYRIRPGGAPELLIEDSTAHLLCHPTNCAFRGDTLFTSNLGRWHITAIDLSP